MPKTHVDWFGFRTKDIHAEGMRLVGTVEMGDAIVRNLSS